MNIPQDHPYVYFKEKDKRILEVYLKEISDAELYQELKTLCEDHLTIEKKGKNKIYLLKRAEVEDFCSTIDSIAKGENIYEEEEEEEESESTDDEMLQKVLVRRFKSRTEEGQKKMITTELEDSDLEDTETLSKRIRYLQSQINALKSQVEKLEQK